MYSQVSFLLILGLTVDVFAQNAPRTKLPETLVVRFHKDTKKMEIFESKEALKPVEDPTITERSFNTVSIKPQKPVNELDKDSSTNSSYYFGAYYGGNYYWNFNYFAAYPVNYPVSVPNAFYQVYANTYCCSPTYYYGGYAYNYQPYYNYNYGPYSYYYYGYRF